MSGMRTFVFQARDAQGKLLEGRIRERDRERALKRVRENARVIQVESLEEEAPGSDLGRVRRVRAWIESQRAPGPDELARLFRMLVLGLASGIDLRRAVVAVSRTGFSSRLEAALGQVARDLATGSRFSSALGRHPRVFPRHIVGVIRLAEAGGTLIHALDTVADALEREGHRLRRLKAALAYPAMILLAALGMLGAMLVFFLPRMGDTLRSFGLVPSMPVRAVLWASDLAGNGPLVAVLAEVALFTVVALAMWLRTDAGRKALDQFLLKVPVVSRVVVCAGMARLSHGLWMCQASGTGLVSALDLSAGTLGNSVLEAEVAAAREYLKRGLGLPDALRAQPHLDSCLCSLIQVGEESGAMNETLRHSQALYDGRLEHMLETAVSLVEPLVMGFMGLVVGAVALLFLLPLTQLLRNL